MQSPTPQRVSAIAEHMESFGGYTQADEIRALGGERDLLCGQLLTVGNEAAKQAFENRELRAEVERLKVQVTERDDTIVKLVERLQTAETEWDRLRREVDRSQRCPHCAEPWDGKSLHFCVSRGGL